MKRLEEKLSIWRLRSSYITSIVSISLVLFMLGLVGLLILNARELSDYVKENIGFAVIIEDNAKEVDILRLQKNLDASQYVKSTKYITKDVAAEELKEELGEDFVEFLGYNPLLSSIDVQLLAEYANMDSIAKIEEQLKKYNFVKEVFYQESLIHVVNENIQKIGFIILLFSVLLFIISVALINNTIRLSVYSKRFIIKTMQLVGATRNFIQRPFLITSGIQGVISGVISIMLLIGILNFVQQEFSRVIALKNIGLIFILVVIVGVVISAASTYFAVNKYLHIKSSELYY